MEDPMDMMMTDVVEPGAAMPAEEPATPRLMQSSVALQDHALDAAVAEPTEAKPAAAKEPKVATKNHKRKKSGDKPSESTVVEPVVELSDSGSAKALAPAAAAAAPTVAPGTARTRRESGMSLTSDFSAMGPPPPVPPRPNRPNRHARTRSKQMAPAEVEAGVTAPMAMAAAPSGSAEMAARGSHVRRVSAYSDLLEAQSLGMLTFLSPKTIQMMCYISCT